MLRSPGAQNTSQKLWFLNKVSREERTMLGSTQTYTFYTTPIKQLAGLNNKLSKAMKLSSLAPEALQKLHINATCLAIIQLHTCITHAHAHTRTHEYAIFRYTHANKHSPYFKGSLQAVHCAVYRQKAYTACSVTSQRYVLIMYVDAYFFPFP